MLASPEIAADACAFAWVQFLREQPDREQNWQGWIHEGSARGVAAERDRVAASATSRWRWCGHRSDPRDRFDERVRFDAALQELKRLPPELQRVVLIRSQVWKQEDVAEVMGIKPDQVNGLLRAAAIQLAEVNEDRHERERPVASPRAARLRELEDEPPEWLSQGDRALPASVEVLGQCDAGVAAGCAGDR